MVGRPYAVTTRQADRCADRLRRGARRGRLCFGRWAGLIIHDEEQSESYDDKREDERREHYGASWLAVGCLGDFLRDRFVSPPCYITWEGFAAERLPSYHSNSEWERTR